MSSLGFVGLRRYMCDAQHLLKRLGFVGPDRYIPTLLEHDLITYTEICQPNIGMIEADNWAAV